MKDLLAHPKTVRVDQLLQTNSMFKGLFKLQIHVVNCALKISWYYKQCDSRAKCQHQLTGLVFFGVLRVARITFFVGVVVVVLFLCGYTRRDPYGDH